MGLEKNSVLIGVWYFGHQDDEIVLFKTGLNYKQILLSKVLLHKIISIRSQKLCNHIQNNTNSYSYLLFEAEGTWYFVSLVIS